MEKRPACINIKCFGALWPFEKARLHLPESLRGGLVERLKRLAWICQKVLGGRGTFGKAPYIFRKPFWALWHFETPGPFAEDWLIRIGFEGQKIRRSDDRQSTITRRSDNQTIDNHQTIRQSDDQRTRRSMITKLDDQTIRQSFDQTTRQSDDQTTTTRRSDDQTTPSDDHQTIRRPDHTITRRSDHQTTRQSDDQTTRRSVRPSDNQTIRRPDDQTIRQPKREGKLETKRKTETRRGARNEQKDRTRDEKQGRNGRNEKGSSNGKKARQK